jgi:hypothetical protein
MVRLAVDTKCGKIFWPRAYAPWLAFGAYGKASPAEFVG